MDSKGTGIQWTSQKNLEDLEFADDLDLLSHIGQRQASKDSGFGSICSVGGARN